MRWNKFTNDSPRLNKALAIFFSLSFRSFFSQYCHGKTALGLSLSRQLFFCSTFLPAAHMIKSFFRKHIPAVIICQAKMPQWSRLAGRWQVDRSENYEEFLAESGENFFTRKIAAMTKEILEISIEDNEFTVATISKLHSKKASVTYYVDNEEDLEIMVNGKLVQAKAVWIDGKIIVTLGGSADGSMKPQKIIREIIGDELVQVRTSFLFFYDSFSFSSKTFRPWR